MVRFGLLCVIALAGFVPVGLGLRASLWPEPPPMVAAGWIEAARPHPDGGADVTVRFESASGRLVTLERTRYFGDLEQRVVVFYRPDDPTSAEVAPEGATQPPSASWALWPYVLVFVGGAYEVAILQGFRRGIRDPEPAADAPPEVPGPSSQSGLTYRVGGDVASADLDALFAAAWPEPRRCAWNRLARHSLTWVSAYAGGRLIGFVRVAWDGGIHAFVLDPTVHPAWRRRGVGSRLVAAAVEVAGEQGIVWVHVDYAPELRPFYARCGFRPPEAGLLRLPAPVMRPRPTPEPAPPAPLPPAAE